MRTISLILLIAIFALGCSSDQEAKLYDTKANPLDFPAQAVKLLDDVVSERLVTLDEISEAFADLYTNNSSLLDNEQWRNIIDRLGVRLGTRANELVKQGLQGYVRAADYFVLASFARPDDEALADMRTTFTPLISLAPSLPAPSFWSSQPPKTKIGIVRRFYAQGIDGRRFADNYLREQLITPGDLTAAELTIADRAFLAVAGLRSFDVDTALLAFENPGLDLVAINFDPIEANTYQAEFYFSVKETPQSELTLAFRLFSADSTDQSEVPNSVTPFDFDPVPSSQSWLPGSMVMASRVIHYSDPIVDVTFGLMDRSVTPVTYISVKGLDAHLFRLKATADSSK